MSEFIHPLKVIRRDDDGHFTCTTYEIDAETKERRELKIERYRLATEQDTKIHKEGKLVGKTLTCHCDPEDFRPFLLVPLEIM